MSYYNMNLLIILHIILNSSLLLLLIPIVSIQDSEITYNCSGTGGLYVADSNYSQSLTYLVDDLCANAPKNNGFRYASWAEDENNRAYGLANCRGDVSNEDCEACLVNATISANTNSCPYSKGAIIWRDYCQLKYSDVDFRGEIDEDYVYSMANEEHSIGLNDDVIVRSILSNISSHIDVNTLFDNGSADVGGGMILYGMVQCTGDLSKDNCTKCLEDATKYIDATRVGARLLFGSCNVRYETYQFLN
ncbi:hypothetical protein CASFOL_031356 [Castilleja foliolosa]|uniref:Gnk2-homologous domain-containing protein n=1 Tax=Castilleja foliolosa TaxID=1961234 RepID=A0ABD3C4H3_9LAMI